MVWLPWKRSSNKNDDSDLMNSSPKNAVPLQDVSPEQKEQGEKKKVNKVIFNISQMQLTELPDQKNSESQEVQACPQMEHISNCLDE